MTVAADIIEFGIVGAGWRSEFFLRIAAACPERMRVCGMVVRDPDKARIVAESSGVPVFADIDSMLGETKPSFVVASVSAVAMPSNILDLVRRGVPVLAETPPATDLAGLVALNAQVAELGGKVQVAEQYWAQPHHAARLAIAHGGRLGPISQAHVSVCHGYHGISLIRRFLGIGFECPTIRADRFVSPVLAGPGRDGPPATERLEQAEMLQAWLDFGDRLGVFEFSLPQYRNWVRGQKLCIRGERGEILDQRVTWMKNPLTPITGDLVRHEAGRNGNLEGHHLKGIQVLDDWVYTNPLAPARLSDEEIAIGTCLLDMDRYLTTGEDFYSLAEASQDQYLALCMERAAESGERLQTEPQPWAGSRPVPFERIWP